MSQHVVPIAEHQALRVAAEKLLTQIRQANGRLTALNQHMLEVFIKFLELHWSRFDRDTAMAAASIWKQALGPARPIPGPIPGDKPSLLVVDQGSLRVVTGSAG